MAQQPNLESVEENLPRPTPEPGPPGGWRSSKPGIPAGPDDVPRGSGFGSAGPDPGWAVRLVEMTELPDEDLKPVVIGLVQARAASLGRAAVKEDIAAALLLCGYGDADSDSAEARRRRDRWLAAARRDKRPGATAVADVDPQLIAATPERIRTAVRGR